jgi:hypothetical protein
MELSVNDDDGDDDDDDDDDRPLLYSQHLPSVTFGIKFCLLSSCTAHTADSI